LAVGMLILADGLLVEIHEQFGLAFEAGMGRNKPD